MSDHGLEHPLGVGVGWSAMPLRSARQLSTGRYLAACVVVAAVAAAGVAASRKRSAGSIGVMQRGQRSPCTKYAEARAVRRQSGQRRNVIG